MLPKQYRLAGNRIPTLIRSGTRVSNHFASLIFQPKREISEPTTITAIVPVRVSKKAVERNRTRRLLREAIHQHIVHMKPGYEAIIMAKKIITEGKLIDCTEAVSDLLQKAHLIV